MDIKELAAVAVREASALRTTLSRLNGGVSLAGITGLIKAAPAIIKHVESLAAALNIKGEQKKALAIEIALSSVKLPWWLPERFARYLLDHVIETALSALKDRLP